MQCLIIFEREYYINTICSLTSDSFNQSPKIDDFLKRLDVVHCKNQDECFSRPEMMRVFTLNYNLNIMFIINETNLILSSRIAGKTWVPEVSTISTVCILPSVV